ncbi:hypothetical protein SFRURICE_001826 [Spodoptera frugiperda]|nr:hypothetical protein SFRURICE_001826 [Spodoptera frugiperda]
MCVFGVLSIVGCLVFHWVRSYNLCIKPRVVLCRNRTRCSLQGSQLPSYCGNRGLKICLYTILWSSSRKCNCRIKGIGFDSRGRLK